MKKILAPLYDFLVACIESWIRRLPDHPFSFRLRNFFFMKSGGRIGLKSHMCEGTIFHEPQKIKIGNNTGIGRNCTFDPHPANIILGNDVLIAQGCYLRAGNHNFKDKNMLIRLQGHTGSDIIVEDDVWIGANVCVLKGVRIGKGSIVSAGSVVLTDIPAYAIASGVPARVIGWREETTEQS